MSRPAADYLVYSCELCSKRIFTERSHQGRTGTCPCCGGRHVVGGARVAAEGQERRRAKRVPGDERTTVEVADDLMPLRDLSETGVGLQMPIAPAVRDVLGVTLYTGDAEPQTFKAEVRRVEPNEELGGYTVGARFVGLDERQRAELRRLVDDLSTP